MKGYITVKRLNKSGNYVSALDFDKTFIDNSNKKGYFKMLIQLILNCDNKYEIKYIKDNNDYIVSGEAYIITGSTEKDIDNRLLKYRENYKDIIQTKVLTKNELW